MKINPEYPIYVISKGRWDSRLTSITLDTMRVPYKICVEPAEYKQYARVIDPKKIIELPENFSERGQGGIPVRNWVWEDSLKNGDKRHWILDDNIQHVYFYGQNTRIKMLCGQPFRLIEVFVDRYKNVGLAGMNYDYLFPQQSYRPPVSFNTRIYSCILIRNDLPYRWRGRYNEDTDLSLRALKDGWVTCLFNIFLCGKITTMTMKGGNTDSIYNQGDERKEFAESLKKQHPDVVKVIRRYKRWHHHVDYGSFKTNTLEWKDDVKNKISKETNWHDLIKRPIDSFEGCSIK